MSLFKDNNNPQPKDILFQDTLKEKQKEQERLQLLHELKDKLTPAQKLYSDVDKLKEYQESFVADTSDFNTGGIAPNTSSVSAGDFAPHSSHKLEEVVQKSKPLSEYEKPTYRKGLTDKEDLTPAKVLYGKERKKQEVKLSQQILPKTSIEKYEDIFPLKGAIEKLSSETQNYDKQIKNAEAAKQKDKFEKDVKNWETKIKLNKYVPIFGKLAASWKGGPDAAGMINLSEGKNLPLYTKDAVKIKNINDEQLDKYDSGNISKHKSYIEQKLKDQFKDFAFKLEDIDGHIFKSNSAPVKRIKQSEEFKNILVKNKDAILNGKRFSGNFKEHGAGRGSNLHNAFGNADFLNSGIDKNGNLHLYMFDTYDFNKGESAQVEAGRRQMMKGNLKGQFSLHEIVVSKDELGELWN